MILNLTDLSPEPLQQQIIRQIRARVLSGEIPAGMALPSIRGFAREHRVSVITVQRAYEELAREGLIVSRRGKGFFVNDLTDEAKKIMAGDRVHDELGPIIAQAIDDGLSVKDIKDIIAKLLNENGSR